MNLSGKGALAGDQKLSTTRIRTLNPNAAEFIPSSVKPASGITSTAEVSSKFTSSASTALGKAALDRSHSLVSNNSDEEAHQYWHHQLPDDITPDFKETGDADLLGIDSLSLSSLALNDNEASQFLPLPGNGFMRSNQHVLSPRYTNGNSLDEKFRYPISSYGHDLPLASLRHYSSKPWDKQIINNDQLLSKVREGAPYDKKSRHGFVADVINRQQYSEIADANPLGFLASQFPGFAVESLAEVYFSNGCNLNSTVEMLRQLEVDGGLNQNVNFKALLGPVLRAMDFPALSIEDDKNSLTKLAGDNIQQNVSPYHSSEKSNLLLFKPDTYSPSGGAIDFASAARKVAPQDTGMWKYESNRSANTNVGSSRSSHLLASSYQSGQVGGMLGDRLQSRGSGRAVPAWLETGEAFANMYPEMREEARDHVRKTYLEQVRQAYMTGNKALAKDLTTKGQLHHVQMKAAHGKAQDSIYRHRNPVGLEIQSNVIGRVPERTIDLLGMHINEALHVLKHELAALRIAARSVDQLVHVYIRVGAGHHTRGSHTPSRLPIAVQRFLLDEEGLDYAEPQPGLLRVLIY